MKRHERRKLKDFISASWLLPRLSLSLAAFAATFVLIEIALRILGLPAFPAHYNKNAFRFSTTNIRTKSGPFYVNQPGRITFLYDGNPRGYFESGNAVHHDVNPSGFRGPAFTPKADGTFRMLFLGDSFTFGEGVHNYDIYPEITASILRRYGHQAESCNLGVGGYNTSQELEVLEMVGFDLLPDAVIVGYTMNDAEPALFKTDPSTGKPVRRPREVNIEAEGLPTQPPDSILLKSHIAKAVWKAHHTRRLSDQTIKFYKGIHSPASEGRIESERALREIINECKKRDIPCIVVMFPLMFKLSEDYPFKNVHHEIAKVVRSAGGVFIDLLPELMGRDAQKLIVHPTDQHPNEKVHAIAGQLLADEIEQIIKSTSKP